MGHFVVKYKWHKWYLVCCVCYVCCCCCCRFVISTITWRWKVASFSLLEQRMRWMRKKNLPALFVFTKLKQKKKFFGSIIWIPWIYQFTKKKKKNIAKHSLNNYYLVNDRFFFLSLWKTTKTKKKTKIQSIV